MEEKLSKLSFANAALFGILLAAGYYFLFYNPSNPENRLSDLNQEIGIVKAEIAKLDRKIKEGQKVHQEIEIMQKKADKIYAQLPENLSVATVSSVISQEARTVGLSIESINSNLEWSKQKTVAKVEVDVAVLGSFNQIMLFLSELTRNNRVYSISTLSISESTNDKSDVLTLTARIQAYRKLSEQEIKDAENPNGGA